MSVVPTGIRSATVAGTTCVAGVVLIPILPIVGFPLCAIALAGLVYRGSLRAAAVIAGLAVLVAALLNLSDVAVVVPGLVAVLVSAAALRRKEALTVAMVLVPVFAISYALGEYTTAWLAGLTYREYVGQIVTLMEPAMTGLSAAGAATGEELVNAVVRFAPSGYIVMAVATVIPTIAAIGWAARGSATEVNRFPSLDKLDLTPHVVWLPIVALGCMAAGRFLGEPEGLVATVGLNVLLAARVALFLQGLGVVDSWLQKSGVGRVGRVLGWVAALLVDAATWIVSLMGLIDFWANLRKLDRGETVEEGSDSGSTL